MFVIKDAKLICKNIPEDGLLDEKVEEELYKTIEKFSEKIKPNLSLENDGIGSYEYNGANGFDKGITYPICEGGEENLQLINGDKLSPRFDTLLQFICQMFSENPITITKNVGVTENFDGFEIILLLVVSPSAIVLYDKTLQKCKELININMEWEEV
jgi:hypothetical protein